MSVVYTVADVMSKPLITVDGENFVNEAIVSMVSNEISAVVVTEKGKPVGIVTDRDFLKKCCGERSCAKVKVGEVMSKPLITVDAETPIMEALRIMADKKIRRLLITEEGKIVGIATQKDLLKGHLEEHKESSRALDRRLFNLLH